MSLDGPRINQSNSECLAYYKINEVTGYCRAMDNSFYDTQPKQDEPSLRSPNRMLFFQILC